MTMFVCMLQILLLTFCVVIQVFHFHYVSCSVYNLICVLGVCDVHDYFECGGGGDDNSTVNGLN